MTRQQQISRGLLILSTGLLSWLGMMIVHEFGHILHAWISRGRVSKVVLHPLAISRTDIDPNPHPLIVVWGGPVWGCIIPIGMWLVARKLAPDFTYLFAFFAGFCLIANGAYLGVGFWNPVGDAVTLLDLGASNWQLLVFGLLTIPTGFWYWHGLGPSFGIGKNPRPIDARVAYTLALLTALLIVVELIFSERL